MRLLLSFCFCLISHLTFSQNWQIIWEDNFDGSQLDLSKWTHDIGSGSQFGLWGWGNGELQFYQSQNTELENGIATITVKEEPSGLVDSWNNSFYYSSSKITTKGKFDFRYGKVEARIKSIDGQGFWPAFWMLPTNGQWPCDGEIDIMEQWGNNYLTNSTTGAAHIGTCPYSQASHFYQNFSSYISSGSYADEFHTYSIVWKPDTIKWYVDEVEKFVLTPSSYFSIPNQHEWPFNSNEWYIMINLAITQDGPNLNTVFPNQIEIDYVRVFQDISTSSLNYEIKDFDFFPNPTKEKLYINKNLIQSVHIHDLSGKLLLKKIINDDYINVDFLNSGIYIVTIKGKNGNKKIKKLIIK